MARVNFLAIALVVLFLYVAIPSSIYAVDNEFKVFINNSLVKSGESITVPESNTVHFEIRQTSDKPIQLDLTGKNDIVHKLTGRSARFVTSYNPGEYIPTILIGNDTKSFKLSVNKGGTDWKLMIPTIMWPLAILIMFFSLFFWGGLRGFFSDLRLNELQYGNITIKASSLNLAILKKIKEAKKKLEIIFPPEYASQNMPFSLDTEISYYVHIFEFLCDIGIKPENVSAWNTLGLYYFNKDLGKAERAFNGAIEADPKNPAGYSNLGMLYFIRKKDTNRAKQYLLKSIKVSQENKKPCPFGYLWLASISYELKDLENHIHYTEEAKSEFEKAIKRDKSDFWSYFGLGWCSAQGKEKDLDKAIENMNLALEHKEDFIAARYNLACYSARKGDAERTVNALKDILQLSRKTLQDFGFEGDPDFRTVSSDQKFISFCDLLGLKYSPPD